MKISDGAVKLLKEYAVRTLGLGPAYDPALAYNNGIQEGITILAKQILEYIKESE